MEIKVHLRIGKKVQLENGNKSPVYKLEVLFQLENGNKSSFKNWEKYPIRKWK